MAASTTSSPPNEVAALEVLDSWDKVIEVGPTQAMARLNELIGSGKLDPGRLADAADTESAATRARLRDLLRRAGKGDLAARVRRPDMRTETRALAGLVAA